MIYSWDAIKAWSIESFYDVETIATTLDTSISNKSIVVGSPCLFADSNRTVTSSLENYNNIHGYSYIYNLNSDLSGYHIGNVFYRNGLIRIQKRK